MLLVSGARVDLPRSPVSRENGRCNVVLKCCDG